MHLQSSDEGVTARLVATNEAARAALAAQLPDLRSRLSSAGVNLGELNVSNGQAGSGSEHASGNGSETPVVRAVAPATTTPGVGTTGAALPSVAGTVNVIA